MVKIINGKEYVTSKAYWTFGYGAGFIGVIGGMIWMWLMIRFT